MMFRFTSKLIVLLLCVPLSARAEGQTLDLLFSKIADKTYRIEKSDGHIQVLYFDVDGRVFAWVPGRFDVKIDAWMPKQVIGVERTGQGGKRVGLVDGVCVGRQTQSSALVTFDQIRVPRNPKCRSWADVAAATLEQADGDVLNLRSGSAPCRLCRASDPLARLLP